MRRAVGVDIGATNTRIALVDEKGHVLRKVSYATDAKDPLGRIFKEIEKFPDFSGIGIAVAGAIDMNRGIVFSFANAKIRNLRIIDAFRRKFKQPSYLLNDGVAGALAEKFFGRGKGIKNLVYLTFSTGIGGGVIENGELLLGREGNAHNVGHFILDHSSRLRCGCGGFGHWETFCGGKSMPTYAKHLLETRYKGESSKLRGLRNLDAKTLFALAKSDRVAAKILEEIKRVNAVGIANTADAYDPELITIGGSVMLNNKDVLMDHMRELVRKYVRNRMPRIEVTSLGDAPLLGAAAYVFYAEK